MKTRPLNLANQFNPVPALAEPDIKLTLQRPKLASQDSRGGVKTFPSLLQSEEDKRRAIQNEEQETNDESLYYTLGQYETEAERNR